MRKKTLIILLVIPFIIAILSFVSVAILDNTVLTDISDILWNYEEYEGFQISTTERYRLEATPVAGANVKLANGNELTWRVDKINESDPEFATVEDENGIFYLKALAEGECKVICSNVRGTKSKYFYAEIYKDGAIVLNTTPASSSESVTGNRCYGEYDIKYSNAAYGAETLKEKAKFTINVKVLGSDGDYYIAGKSDNISISNNKDVTINGANDESFITVRTLDDTHLSKTYNFSVIKDGINVYSYNDLLMCTNFSEKGEIVCMQTNLKSYEETFNGQGEYKANNTKLFGNRNSKGQYNFANELYKTETTYSHRFIDQYNKEMGTNYSTDILVAVRAQKNIYGNGFTINAHNLCAPKELATIGKPKLDSADLFRGPLAYVTIGNVSTDSLVKAFGQDNVGLYLDADGIVVDDLKFSNLSNQSNVSNFFYSGSVVDVNAKNVTIKNSILSNGRTVVRAFSSDGLLIDNCNLMNAGEFILKVGSNKFVGSNLTKKANVEIGSSSLSGTVSDIFGTTDRIETDVVPADQYFNEILMGGNLDSQSAHVAHQSLLSLQNALDNKTYEDGEFDSRITIADTNFANSGIFSIAFDSMYNGPYLYSGMPSQIGDVLKVLNGFTVPRGIGGTSMPVKLTLNGNSKFYDWKKAANIDTSALVETNFDILAGAISQLDGLTVDDFFPLKKIIIDLAKKEGRIYKDSNGDEWLNSAFAWYGGGLNNSVLVNNANSVENVFSEKFDVDILKSNLVGDYLSSNANAILAKCVTFAIGFHPFSFITNGALSKGETPNIDGRPQIDDLTNNLNNRG